ncbi:MAG: hypothetical protein U9M98_01555 [Patescibacteria group bacterium]|nr:hypothetical protein [Patescibacteria group bacterium]
MRKILAVLIVLTLALTITSSALADGEEYTEGIADNPHKIRNKWDLSGTFETRSGYDWGGLAEGTWTYKFHIKEAMDGEYSVGSIHFINGDIDVVAHVEATARDYGYWSGNEGNLAAVGTTNYNDTTYYFMFLYGERSVWMALSTTPYDSYWANQTVWGSSLRAYQVHSPNTYDFPLDYKMINQ